MERQETNEALYDRYFLKLIDGVWESYLKGGGLMSAQQAWIIYENIRLINESTLRQLYDRAMEKH